MKVLHYALGFPPYRSGGLTKFCIDLMAQQTKEGHTAALLWPGAMYPGSQRAKIVDRGWVKGIKSYELINPLPVSFGEGIADPKSCMQSYGAEEFTSFLTRYGPDVIHIHTLLGLPESFVTSAQTLGIHMVFTAHDFFPICSTITLYRNKKICTEAEGCAGCPECNAGALPIWKIAMMQSPLYRSLKSTPVVRRLRRQHINRFNRREQADIADTRTSASATVSDYQYLRSHYAGMLDRMDRIHYNSTITRDVYERFLPLKVKSEIISITHANISDNRRHKCFGEPTRISYLGPPGGAKGFFC